MKTVSLSGLLREGGGVICIALLKSQSRHDDDNQQSSTRNTARDGLDGVGGGLLRERMRSLSPFLALCLKMTWQNVAHDLAHRIRAVSE